MSDTTIAPEATTGPEEALPVPTHDPFQAPIAPEIVDGAAQNKIERERHELALAALKNAFAAVKAQQYALVGYFGHKVISGTQIALAAANSPLIAEINYVQECIAKLPPVPAE